jgi:hypothetical protein
MVVLGCDTPGGGPCVPMTCQSAGAACGPVWDGCGEFVECGLCDDGVTCGSHAPNRCGEVPVDADVVDVSPGDDTSADTSPSGDTTSSDTGEDAGATTDAEGDTSPTLTDTPDIVEPPSCTSTQLLCAGACADCPAGAGHECAGAACLATGCEVGQHHTGAACSAWTFESIAAERSDYVCAGVGTGGQFGACWRSGNLAVWGLRASDGTWQRWTSAASQVPVAVAVDGDGALWTVWWESFNGANYYLDRWPNRLAQPLLLGLSGRDAAMARLASGAPAVAFAGGTSATNALTYLEAPGWSATPVVASPAQSSAGRVALAVGPSGAVVVVASGTSVDFFRKNAGAGWTKASVAAPEVIANRAVSLAVDGAGVAYAALLMGGKLALANQGTAGSGVTVVDSSPGAGDNAGVAVTPAGKVFIVDTDAENDLRLHVAPPGGSFTTETIVAGRSRGTSAVAMDTSGTLHVTFVYEFASGAREVRYGTLRTGP